MPEIAPGVYSAPMGAECTCTVTRESDAVSTLVVSPDCPIHGQKPLIEYEWFREMSPSAVRDAQEAGLWPTPANVAELLEALKRLLPLAEYAPNELGTSEQADEAERDIARARALIAKAEQP